ncbi:cysteine desulfurase family protein [Streptomyces sp. NPDC051913]|uniref:cysteine desulfurase family protein n=1 Tax=Streptomyces sp. NPDC051913 TaxID=3365676 RepID=UPI0037D62B8C
MLSETRWGMTDGVDRLVSAYLDYNATAPIRPEALAAVVEALQAVGNASSVHHPGRDAAHRVDVARRHLADLLNCSPGEIIFTSGATEANNLALRAAHRREARIVTSGAEHPAVLETARDLAQSEPGSLTVLPMRADGLVETVALEEELGRGDVGLVSLMAANNETGVLTDLTPVVKAAHAAGALVHTDATQMIGRLPLDLSEVDVDLLSLSAHKFGGPQGVGALFVRRGTPLPFKPLITGGGQEKGWRAGTLNVPGIAGAGAAAAAVSRDLADDVARVTQLRDQLEHMVTTAVGGCRINGQQAPRLPGVASITFAGAPADAVMAAMPHIAASDGSACASGAPTPSHVLLAMGLSREEADCTVRFSLGYATTADETAAAAEAVVRAVHQVRAAMAATAGAAAH